MMKKSRVEGDKVPESKVVGASSLALLSGFGLAVGNNGDIAGLGALPEWAQFIVLTIGPPILTFIGGFVSPHTDMVSHESGPAVTDTGNII